MTTAAACSAPAVCGDGVITGTESCDDGTPSPATAATPPARPRSCPAAATAWSRLARPATTATPCPATAATPPASSRSCPAAATASSSPVRPATTAHPPRRRLHRHLHPGVRQRHARPRRGLRRRKPPHRDRVPLRHRLLRGLQLHLRHGADPHGPHLRRRNGRRADGEDCDDSGESATCNSNCTTSSCGDGTVNATAGELCDDSGESAMCDDDCTPAACGDGNINATAARSATIAESSRATAARQCAPWRRAGPAWASPRPAR